MSIKDRVRKVVAHSIECEAKDLKDTDSFQDDYAFDSLDHIELVLSLEEEFASELGKSKIPDDLLSDPTNLTLGKATDLIKTFVETLN